MNIYITRHSKTIWNEEKRLQGCKDSPLSAKGLQNAECLKNYIKDLHFDKVYSSPILRAYTTAQIITSLPIIQDDRIMEFNFGDLEGRKINDLDGSNLEDYSLLWNHPELSHGVKNGENYDLIENRIDSFINDLKKLPYDSNILIVTHGFCFVVLLSRMLNYSRKDYTKINKKVVDGCSLTLVNYSNNSFQLEYYGDNHYLKYISNEVFAR